MFDKTIEFLDSMSIEELTVYLSSNGFKFVENSEYTLKSNTQLSNDYTPITRHKYNLGRDKYYDYHDVA